MRRRLKGLSISFSFGVLLFAVYFLVLEDVLVSAVVAGITFLFFLFVVDRKLLEYSKKREKEHEDYRFIYSFVVSLSTTGSLINAYERAMEGASQELLEVTKGLGDKKIEEKIEYLSTYFDSDTYSMFASLFALYVEQGGDFLKMCSPLLAECSRAEEEGNRKEQTNKRTLREYSVLWGLSLLVIGTVRFALSGFYEQMKELMSYKLSSLLILPVLFVSLYLFFTAYCGPIKKVAKK